MLTRQQQELISSYLDGELSLRERQMVRQLLKSSVEAREFYEQLKQDSGRLRSLPRHSAPEHLVEQTVKTIVRLERPIRRMGRPVRARNSRAFPNWLGVAIAASLMFSVAAASYFFFSSRLRTDSPEQFADTGPVRDDASLADRSSVPPRLRLAIGELAKEENRDRLSQALRAGDAFKLEVVCRDSRKAVQRLQDVLKTTDVGLVVDSQTQEALGKKGGKYVLYMENVMPFEISTVFYDLAKGEIEMPSTVKEVALFALSSRQQQQLAGLLGVRSEDLASRYRENRDMLKDLPGIVPIPAKKGRKQGKPGPQPKEPTRLAVLIPIEDGKSQPGPAVQRFLQSRREMDPHAIRVVFVLHETLT